ncbi:glycosyltransferase [Galbibacter orientalis DSM 19592]|uniref:Glycosyltransferase n=1 Tax=Galbibacter orientalis DSM 19592 TaxID=926559 RepID=I3C790_9FLAO|nr:glycosyltransferase family 4 protein [Galbibacter orientalis]EIJ39483.1 glycosyltransferase [Galbibacter orientalis DSM 19592]
MKKNIVIILSIKEKALTGGQKYDIHFLNELKEASNDINIIVDERLKYNSKISLLYNLIYLSKLKTLMDADVLICNSRLYPRLFLLLPFLNILNRKLTMFAIHHHYNYFTLVGFKRVINKFLEVGFLKRFSGLIIPSRYVYDLTQSVLKRNNLFLLEIGFIKKGYDIEKKPLNSSKLLYVGTIEKRKGLHLLIESIKDIKVPYKLNIIGKYDSNDSYYLSLKKMIEDYKLSDKIIFHGRVSDEKLDSFYKSSSVFVFPSLHEGYGMVIVEAMQYGLPVVAFNNSAMPYLIENGVNGYLVNNKEEFNQFITKILVDKNELICLRGNIQMQLKSLRTIKDLNKDINAFYIKELIN